MQRGSCTLLDSKRPQEESTQQLWCWKDEGGEEMQTAQVRPEDSHGLDVTWRAKRALSLRRCIKPPRLWSFGELLPSDSSSSLLGFRTSARMCSVKIPQGVSNAVNCWPSHAEATLITPDSAPLCDVFAPKYKPIFDT